MTACAPIDHPVFDCDVYDCPCGHMYGMHEYRHVDGKMIIDRCTECSGLSRSAVLAAKSYLWFARGTPPSSRQLLACATIVVGVELDRMKERIEASIAAALLYGLTFTADERLARPWETRKE